MACGILVPWPGVKPTPLALEEWSLNHWTSREVPQQDGFCYLNKGIPIRFALNQWFSYPGAHPNHLEDLLKHRFPEPVPRVSDAVHLKQDPTVCICNKLSSDAGMFPVQASPHFEIQSLLKKETTVLLCHPLPEWKDLKIYTEAKCLVVPFWGISGHNPLYQRNLPLLRLNALDQSWRVLSRGYAELRRRKFSRWSLPKEGTGFSNKQLVSLFCGIRKSCLKLLPIMPEGRKANPLPWSSLWPLLQD